MARIRHRCFPDYARPSGWPSVVRKTSVANSRHICSCSRTLSWVRLQCVRSRCLRQGASSRGRPFRSERSRPLRSVVTCAQAQALASRRGRAFRLHDRVKGATVIVRRRQVSSRLTTAVLIRVRSIQIMVRYDQLDVIHTAAKNAGCFSPAPWAILPHQRTHRHRGTRNGCWPTRDRNV